MHTASRVAIVLTALQGAIAFAHPVSQGAIAVNIDANRIAVHAMVSPEEVIIAAAAAPGSVPSFAQAVRQHGAYLLSHLLIKADGRALPGHLVAIPDPTVGRPSYDIEYPLHGLHPHEVEMQEDVLREIEFAPGNPWEAMYLVGVDRSGESEVGGSEGPGLLLSFRQPVDIDCQWNGASVTVGRPTRAAQLMEFVRHGILHILTGYDHLLFVGALVLAIQGLWDLVRVISAFTLAHSITLTLAALDIVRLPTGVVEPMIAASIVAVAAQNIFWPRHSHGWSRMTVAFAFGLFHGLGFAGGLLDAMSSLHGGAAAAAIASFSIGVELGQQIVVLPVFAVLWLIRQHAADTVRPMTLVQQYGSIAISLAGVVYLGAALRP
jgi:hypothetical protein